VSIQPSRRQFIGGVSALALSASVLPLKSAPKGWSVKCVDTMKTSRDKVRVPLDDDHRQLIDVELDAIKSIGANYVAIDTPYDPEFLLFLRYWVGRARLQNLHVWFRGNWCGWEGWFGYPKWVDGYNRHIEATIDFVRSHPDLFRDGDSFCLCPEPENSALLGDPRATGHVDQFLAFLRDAYDALTKEFARMGKRVIVNWFSVNGDIGRDILNKNTVDHIGGLVTIDHDVPSAAKMIEYVDDIHHKFGCKVLIGEFGAPLVNINPVNWNEQQQADFIGEILEALWVRRSYVIGISYWVGAGDGKVDTTRLIDTARMVNPTGEGYHPRLAAEVLRSYFQR
jgi:hypothetical protein